MTVNFQSARQALEHQLHAITSNLENGVVRIVVCGNINVGKTSLVNALLQESRFEVAAVGGATGRVQEALLPHEYTISGFQSSCVVIVDTPGFGEVDNAERGKLAMQQALSADLVLVVVNDDLTQGELDAMTQLFDKGKPLLLVLNQVDRLSPEQRDAKRQSLLKRTHRIIPADCYVETASQPITLVQRELADGTISEIERIGRPDIAQLKSRIITILDSEGLSLVAVNALISLKQLDEAHKIKRMAAAEVVETYAFITALGVALNPIPVADVLGAMAANGMLIRKVGAIYGYTVSSGEGKEVFGALRRGVKEISKGVFAYTAASALKFIPGPGHIAAFFIQAGMAAYTTNVVGMGAVEYFAADMTLTSQQLQSKVRTVLESTDRKTYAAQVAERLQKLQNDSVKAQ